MLSPTELLSVRSQEQTLPQRSHGQKDFLPDNSKVQEEHLQICRTEEWELLREERVERLGNLGRGIWKPEEDLVELTLPAGKFWQTMGFTKRGRQCLQPEEAVYLLECGTIQVFYRNLPLTVQEAYEKLISGGSISLLHYQVYSHLKRMGYIINRFNQSSIQTPYEIQLNLDTYVKPNRKRKRSSSPCLKSNPETTRNNDKEEKVTLSFHVNAPCVTTIKENTKNNNDAAISQITSPKSPCTGNEMERCILDTVIEASVRTSQTTGHIAIGEITCSANFRWDFSKIFFPNCASNLPYVELPAPEPALLPENVLGHPTDVSRWLRKLNLRQDKFSQREREQCDWEDKNKISINADSKVKKCTNWKEYKQLLQERAGPKNEVRPSHLWKTTVQPLLRPGYIRSTASVLEEITVMSHSTMLDDGKRITRMQNKPKIQFNLYQADGTSEFKKSKPGKPYAHLSVGSFDEHIPSLLTLKTFTYHSLDVPVVFALVDYGEVSFYTFKDFQLPVDVYP